MKRILLSYCLLSFIASNILFSQAKLNVDSLTAVLYQYPKEDTVKVKMLIDLVHETIEKDTKKAMEYTETAIKVSEKIGSVFFIAESYCLKGIISLRTGKLEDAKTNIQKAISTLENSKKYYTRVGEYIMMLGSIAIANRDFTNALKLNESALAIFESTTKKGLQVKALINLGVINYQLGSYDKALDFYEKGLKRNESINNEYNAQLLYSNIALINYIKGNYRLFLDYTFKAIAIAERLEELSKLTNDYSNVAAVYLELNDKKEAQKYLTKALEIFRKQNNKTGIVKATIDIAFTYDDHQKAITDLKKAIEYCKEIKDNFLLAYAFQSISYHYFELLDYQSAYLYAQQGLELEKEVKDNENTIKLNNQIAKILIFCNDGDLRSFGIEPNDRLEKAKKYVNAVFSLTDNGNLKQTADAWNYLSAIQEKQQNFTAAYESYKKYIALKDSISGDDIKKQITRKEIQYEFDKKEAVLKYEQQLTADELEKERLLNFQQGQALLLNRQTLTLKEQALAISNKEKDLVHLAFLKEQAEKQEKEQALLVAQKDKDLASIQILNLAKEKALQLQEIARKNATIGFLGVSVLAILLAAALFYLWLKKRQIQVEAARQVELQAAFTQQLFTENEAERARIARDLHDGISHELLGLKRASLPSNSDAAQKIDGIIESIRQISRNLHPVMLDSIGLQLSIETFCEQFAEAHNLFINHGINYSNKLHKNTELQILRIIQEALTNVAKHANAQAANVSMSDYDNGILLKIQDNGKGFDVEKVLNSGSAFGLQSIIERAKIINTKANIFSTPNGTIIELKIS